jgi:hypothetical protein
MALPPGNFNIISRLRRAWKTPGKNFPSLADKKRMPPPVPDVAESHARDILSPIAGVAGLFGGRGTRDAFYDSYYPLVKKLTELGQSTGMTRKGEKGLWKALHRAIPYDEAKRKRVHQRILRNRFNRYKNPQGGYSLRAFGHRMGEIDNIDRLLVNKGMNKWIDSGVKDELLKSLAYVREFSGRNDPNINLSILERLLGRKLEQFYYKPRMLSAMTRAAVTNRLPDM